MSFVAGELARLAEVAKARLEARHPERFPEFLEQLAAARQEQYLAHVLATSQFVVDQLERHLPQLVELVDATWFLERSWRVDDWYQALARAADEADSEAALMKSLREFRNREMLRIIWRDFSRQADLEQTLAACGGGHPICHGARRTAAPTALRSPCRAGKRTPTGAGRLGDGQVGRQGA
jgi:glutamine synthetase adenylyltransferase